MLAERQPDIRGEQSVGAAEAAAGDADDGVDLAVDAEPAADEVGTAAALGLPVRIADDHDRDVRARAGLLGGKEAAGCRRRAEHGEVVVRNLKREAAAHGLVLADAGEDGIHRGDLGEAVLRGAQRQVLGVGELAVVLARVLARREDVDHLLRLDGDDLPQQDAVHQGEERRVDADRQREGQDGDGGEARRLGQGAEGELEIGEHG